MMEILVEERGGLESIGWISIQACSKVYDGAW